MSRIADKIINLISNHAEYSGSLNRVTEEIKYLEDNDVLQQLFSIYQEIQEKTCKQGNTNEFNSLIAYMLGITICQPDISKPFIIPPRRTYARVSLPDIDMDFEHDKRHLIIEYCRKKYGADFVAKIGTKQNLKVKLAVRKAVKVLDPENNIKFDKEGNVIKTDENFNFQLENRILNTLPKLMKKPDGTVITTVKEAYELYREFREYMDKYPEVYKLACQIQGLTQAFGTHASGYIVSSVPINKIAPLCVTRDSNTENEEGEEQGTATQFSMGEIESLGLIKMDFLGLRTKTAMTECMKLIAENYGQEFASSVDLSNLPLNDPETFSLIKSLKTDGLFQIEGYGMKNAMQQMGVDCFDDLVAAIAMFRPGPMKFIPLYGQRKANPKSVTYLHPIMKKHTESTYSIMIFQEQCANVFVELAGLTLGEGFLFIKGAAKKKPELFNSLKERFIKGATKIAGASIAGKVWDQLQPFAGYGFNAGHAWSYGYESLKTAYLKAHFPTEFICARLSVEAHQREFETVEKYEKDAVENFGMKILPVDLNRSKMKYTIVGERTLLRPLILKEIGDGAIEDIVAHQPFTGKDLFYSFAMSVGSKVSRSVVEALCDAKIFAPRKKSEILAAYEIIKKEKTNTKKRPVGDIYD